MPDPASVDSYLPPTTSTSRSSRHIALETAYWYQRDAAYMLDDPLNEPVNADKGRFFQELASQNEALFQDRGR